MNKKILTITIVTTMFLTTILAIPVSSYNQYNDLNDYYVVEEVNNEYEIPDNYFVDSDNEEIVEDPGYKDLDYLIDNSDFENLNNDLLDSSDVLNPDDTSGLSDIREGPSIDVDDWEFDFHEPYDIVVITTKAMKNSEPLKRYVAAKEILQGLKVKIKTVEEIYDEYPLLHYVGWHIDEDTYEKVYDYVDLLDNLPSYAGPYAIHEFLTDQWENNGIQYCLFVGDDSKYTRAQPYGMGNMGRYHTGYHRIDYLNPNVEDPQEVPSCLSHLWCNCLDDGDVYCVSDHKYCFLDKKFEGNYSFAY